MTPSPDLWHGTTILTVRKGGVVAIGGDGQVSIGQTIVKANAKKVRRLAKGDVIGGFAGATADAFTLFERLEAKLEQYPGQLKRAVAIALRNRWRRMQLDERLREEVLPKNILMIGPTGVGKTEISRRLARLAGAPFLKVEATKFTEVGYVGRDVEQIVRDLVEIAILQLREKKRKDVQARAELAAEERVLSALVGPNASPATKDAFRKKLRAGELDDKEIEIEIQASSGGMPL